MRGFLDLSDNRLAVVLERAGHHHEAGEDQVALQSLTTHLSHLNRDMRVKHTLLFPLPFPTRGQEAAFHMDRHGVPADGSGVPSPCIPAPELELLHETSLGALHHSWPDTRKTGSDRN